MAKLVIGNNKQNGVPAVVMPSNVTDEFANYIDIMNMFDGTSVLESAELVQACDDISQFLYGTNNI